MYNLIHEQFSSLSVNIKLRNCIQGLDKEEILNILQTLHMIEGGDYLSVLSCGTSTGLPICIYNHTLDRDICAHPGESSCDTAMKTII